MNTLVTVFATVNLRSKWNEFWGAFKDSTGMDQIIALASFIGVGLIAWSLLKWAWDRRRGQGGGGRGGQGVMGSLVIGLVLIAPEILFPVALQIMDVIANAALKIWESSGGKTS